MLHDGKIREFDSPYELIQNQSSLFRKMIDSLPENKAKFYRQTAQDKFENKPYKAPAFSPDDDVTRSGSSNQNVPVQKPLFLPAFQTNRINGVLNNFGHSSWQNSAMSNV